MLLSGDSNGFHDIIITEYYNLGLDDTLEITGLSLLFIHE